MKKRDTGMDTFGVTFTPEKLEALKLAMVGKGDDETFEFEGKQWLTSYAKYLIAYLTGAFLAGKREYKYGSNGS